MVFKSNQCLYDRDSKDWWKNHLHYIQLTFNIIAHLKHNDHNADVFPNFIVSNFLFNLAEFCMFSYTEKTILTVFESEFINDEYTHYLISNENILVCSKKVTQIVCISMEHLNIKI